MRIKLHRYPAGFTLIGAIMVVVAGLLVIGAFLCLIITMIRHLPHSSGTAGDTNAPNNALVGQLELARQEYELASMAQPMGYKIETCTNLYAPDWIVLTNYTSTNDFSWQMPIDRSEPQRWFRITTYGVE